MKRSIKRFKSTGPCVFALCYFYEMLFFIFDLLSSTPFALYTTTLLVPVSDWEETKMGLVQFLGLSLHQQLMKDSKFGLTFWLNPHSRHVKTHVNPSTDLNLWWWSAPGFPFSEEAAETIWRAANAVSKCRNTFNFFDYLVIFRHYFTEDGRVSCILATISDWFPNIKILKQKWCPGFL